MAFIIGYTQLYRRSCQVKGGIFGRFVSLQPRDACSSCWISKQQRRTICSTKNGIACGCFPKWGPRNGWFISWKIPSINGWFGGVPPIRKKNSICVLQVLYTNSFADSGTMYVLICSFSFGKCSSISKYAPYINSFQITLVFLTICSLCLISFCSQFW
jgi:hypothetical protein